MGLIAIERERDHGNELIARQKREIDSDHDGEGVGLQLGRRPHDQVGDPLQDFPTLDLIFMGARHILKHANDSN